MRVATRLATHTTNGQLVPEGDVQCWCGFLGGGRYRTRADLVNKNLLVS